MAKRNVGFGGKTKTDVLTCRCGGNIKMRTIAPNGKMKHYAECSGCKSTARKPRMLMR